jgi:secondary thiamine-phosphate synthase enzyme
METGLNRIVPQSQPFIHTIEGPDDMPAHIKSALLGVSVTIPIASGKLAFGTWQGVYLCEHREHGGRRRILATLQGE